MARFDLSEGEWSIIAPLLPNKRVGCHARMIGDF
jgi:transposase